MLQIFHKLQSLIDTSILTMICTRFICALIRNRIDDNPIFTCNQSYLLSTFPATASRVCKRDCSAPESVAPEGKLEIVTIGKGNHKQTFVIFCALYSPYNCWRIWIVIFSVVLYSQKRFLYQMSTTGLLFPTPIRPHFLECRRREPWQNTRAFPPKIIPYR